MTRSDKVVWRESVMFAKIASFVSIMISVTILARDSEVFKRV